MVNMRRREFISLLGAAAAWPVAAGAQQPPMPVVGYLGLTTAEADAYLIAAFRDGLAEAVLLRAAISPLITSLRNATSVDCQRLPPNSSPAKSRWSLPRRLFPR